MTRWQRLALGIGLLATAITMHFAFCDWSDNSGGRGMVTEGGRTISRVPLLLGVTNRRGIAPHTSAICGLAAPPLILSLGAFVLLGWRRSVRLERGECPACGYPVGPSAKCTECGTVVRPVVAAS